MRTPKPNQLFMPLPCSGTIHVVRVDCWHIRTADSRRIDQARRVRVHPVDEHDALDITAALFGDPFPPPCVRLSESAADFWSEFTLHVSSAVPASNGPALPDTCATDDRAALAALLSSLWLPNIDAVVRATAAARSNRRTLGDQWNSAVDPPIPLTGPGDYPDPAEGFDSQAWFDAFGLPAETTHPDIIGHLAWWHANRWTPGDAATTWKALRSVDAAGPTRAHTARPELTLL